MTVLREMKAQQRTKIGLATLLTGLVSLSVLLTLTIVLISSYQLKKQALFDTTLTLNHSNAAKMSQTLDSLFKSMRSSLQYASGLFAGNRIVSEKETGERLELIRHSSNYFNSIVLVDETGLIRAVTSESAGSAGKFVSSDAAKEALQSRKPYLSNPYASPSNGRLIVFMSEPIFDKEGQYRGFIGGTLYLQENNILNAIFGSNNTDEIGTYFYVVGANGHLLFHRDKSRIGEDVNANTIVRKLVRGESGQERMVNLSGVALLAGYSTVPENGWGVVVVSPISVVRDQLNHDVKAIVLYTLPPFLLLLLAAVWLARILARPFVSLADLVNKLISDNAGLPATRHHWNREADLLTKTVTMAFTNMQKQTDQLTHAAMTDPLTGLWNRRTMETVMNQWIAEDASFAIVVMDIDRFKSINDTYGHHAGDEVLKHLAQVVALSVRPGDIICRYGGEEFVVLLAGASAEEACQVAERIRTAMEATDAPIGKPVAVSLGVALYPLHAGSADALFQRADQALYMSKESGRNRTTLAD